MTPLPLLWVSCEHHQEQVMHHPAQRERETPGMPKDIWAEDVERAEGLARVRTLGVQGSGTLL